MIISLQKVYFPQPAARHSSWLVALCSEPQPTPLFSPGRSTYRSSIKFIGVYLVDRRSNLRLESGHYNLEIRFTTSYNLSRNAESSPAC